MGRAAEQALALRYAPADRQAALMTLFALDARLRAITLAARDPTIGLMRLTWWGEALERLDQAPAPAEPLLRALAAELLPRGITGAALAQLVDGWALMLEGDVEWPAVANRRGNLLFALATAALVEGRATPHPDGSYWAAVDLARDWQLPLAGWTLPPHWSQPAVPRALRALGALALLARFDGAGRTRPGDPRRVARLLIHWLTGR